ncbi:MAG: uroporphyrinogen decarboxylase family protein [Thermodesulfobacteriota bacterium]
MQAEHTGTSLSSLERVRRAIQHHPPDRTPRGEILIDDAVIESAVSRRRIGFEERSEFASLLGLDIICLSPQGPSPQGELPEPGDLPWPDLQQWTRQTGLFVFGILDGPLGWGGKLFGYKRTLTLPIRSPEAWNDFSGKVERLNADLAERISDQGVHGLILADDLAYPGGLLMGSRITKDMILPSLARQAHRMLSGGLPTFFHSDGNITEIIPALAGIGFHGLHCIDPKSGMDWRDLKCRYAGRLCLWGTLTVDDLAQSRDREFLTDLAGKIRETCAGGGFILGTTSGIFKGLDVEALRGIYEQV